MQRARTFFFVSLALLLSCASALPAADPRAIGLGLDGLRMHMTMAEARRAYPALIDRNPDKLSLRDYPLEGCQFSVDLFFTENGLTLIELETGEPVDLSLGFEVCKPAILKRLAEQYGAPQPPPRPYVSDRYFRDIDVMTIYVSQEIGGNCGLVNTYGRYLRVAFRAPDAPIIIC